MYDQRRRSEGEIMNVSIEMGDGDGDIEHGDGVVYSCIVLCSV